MESTVIIALIAAFPSTIASLVGIMTLLQARATSKSVDGILRDRDRAQRHEGAADARRDDSAARHTE